MDLFSRKIFVAAASVSVAAALARGAGEAAFDMNDQLMTCGAAHLAAAGRFRDERRLLDLARRGRRRHPRNGAERTAFERRRLDRGGDGGLRYDVRRAGNAFDRRDLGPGDGRHVVVREFRRNLDHLFARLPRRVGTRSLRRLRLFRLRRSR